MFAGRGAGLHGGAGRGMRLAPRPCRRGGSGCIDVGRLGVAGRYQDLAILWNGLREFDGALGARLFARYGIGVPDERRLRFHLTLDECF